MDNIDYFFDYKEIIKFFVTVIIYFYKNTPQGPKMYLPPTIMATCPSNYTLSTIDERLCIQNCSPGYTSISSNMCKRNPDSQPTIHCDGDMCTSDFMMHTNSVGSTCPRGYYHNASHIYEDSNKNPGRCVKDCDPGYIWLNYEKGNQCYRQS